MDQEPKGSEDLSRLDRFPFTVPDLASRSWQFGRAGAEHPYASHLKLLADGRFGGHPVETEWTWEIGQDCIVVFDRKGRRSTVLDQLFLDPDGRLVLRGPFMLARESGAVHELREVEPVGTLNSEGAPEFIRKGGKALRRNLVVLGANEASLHGQWGRDISDQDRSWDLWVRFYGQPENFGRDPWAEYQSRQVGRGKWAGVHHLCQDGSPLWDYDYVAFPDDDLMMSWSDLNALFVICRQFRLDLAQPSLKAGPVPISHPITAQDSRFLLRFVSFVETMAPIFSRQALRACAETFVLPVNGFGVDNVWPKLIGEPMDRMAVIDHVGVLHTRPMATNYDLAAAVAEGNELQRLYNATSRVHEWGCIYAQPLDVGGLHSDRLGGNLP